ncbi:MAG: hypothetical protein MUE33_00360 [Cytophagaceae bacterium]|jgi:hypothetical protein|nr:hypothetical protein [Cytophagaceae bacterium]
MRLAVSLIVCILSIQASFAQSNSVPKEFKDESVVILELLNEYSFSVSGSKSIITEKKFSRIFLSDKNAVNKYSTFYTTKSSDNDVFVLNIIKPDNSKKVFSYSDGIEEKENVSIPNYFRSNISFNSSYYKFALPDLEPGDIIEYTTINRFEYYGTVAPFTRVYMNGDFPIVINKIRINVEKEKFYIYHNSVLGAPALKVVREGNLEKEYYVSDTLCKKVGFDWKLQRECFIPHVKFVVSNTKSSVRYVIPPADDSKKEFGPVTEKEIKKLFTEFKNQVNLVKYSKKTASIIISEVKAKNTSYAKDPDKMIELCWYYLRYKTINEINYSMYDSYVSTDGDIYFVMVMHHIIAYFKQSSDIFVTSDNKSLPLTEAISPREINWGIRYKDNYMTLPVYYMQYGQVTNSFQGQKGYMIKNYTTKLKPEELTVSTIELPKRHYLENTLKESVSVTIDLEEEPVMTCSRVLTSTNGFNALFIPDYYNVYFNLAQLDFLNMNTIDSSTMYNGYTKAYAQEKRQKDKEALAKYYKGLHERYEEELKNNYDNVEALKSWKITQNGMIPSIPSFEIEESFIMEDAISKVGNGYVVKIGLLLGNYTRFIEDQRIRSYGGMLDLASNKTIQITFTIPDGYKLASTEELSKYNVTFSNDFVELQSTLKYTGNTVTITVVRNFKKQSFTKEEFEGVLKFYDMMFELSQGKLIIKK